MNANLLATLLSYSVIPAAAIALVRFRQVGTSFLPFFTCLILAAANEIISTACNYYGNGNSINANTYVLLESLLMLRLFYNWNAARNKNIYLALAALFIVEWIIETCIINEAWRFSVVFRALVAFVIVLLSGDQLSFILITHKNILRNPRFILCVSFLIQYSYKTFFETFFVIYPALSIAFYRQFMLIWSIVNAVANIIYIPALLWIPRKEKYYITCL